MIDSFEWINLSPLSNSSARGQGPNLFDGVRGDYKNERVAVYSIVIASRGINVLEGDEYTNKTFVNKGFEQSFVYFLQSINSKCCAASSIETIDVPSPFFPRIDVASSERQLKWGHHQLVSDGLFLPQLRSELNLEFLRGISHGLDAIGVRYFLSHRGGGPHTGKADNQHLTNGWHEELRQVRVVHYASD